MMRVNKNEKKNVFAKVGLVYGRVMVVNEGELVITEGGGAMIAEGR